MHARLDDLLSLRDGGPVDARLRLHVAACKECAAELARTQSLRGQMQWLPPAPDVAADGWADVQSRLAASAARSRHVARLSPYAAAASVAALAVFAALRWVEVPAPPASRLEPLIVLEPASLDELHSRSQALEAMLAALPERPAVERADTSLPIESLEEQVQWLDHQLSVASTDGRSPEAERLWRDRVEVMNSLVQLRYVEAQHVVL
jgi:hypothetical protein